MKGELLLAVDVGTSGVKLSVFDAELQHVASTSRGYKTYFPQEGFAEQKPEEWWAAICNGLKELFGRIDARRIAGIGVDGQSWSCIPVDREGNVLFPDPIWYDARARAICDEIEAGELSAPLFACGQNPFRAAYTLPKILWLKRNYPQIYAGTDKFLQSNSYVVCKLTGQFTQDLSQCYGYQIIDLRTGKPDEPLARALGVDTGKIPPAQPCSSVAGKTTPGIEALLGIPSGTPVAAGGLDAACGTLGVGVCEAGQTQEQSGQAGGMSICTEEPKGCRELIFSPHVLAGKYLLQGGTTGGAGVLRWMEQEFACHTCGGREDYSRFLQEAETIPAGSDGVVFLPYMAGERSPIWNERAKGAFYGLDFSKTKAHMIRAALEGVAFSLLHNLKTAEACGARVTEMVASGGATKSALWMQIKADVTGRRLHVADGGNSTVLGAAALAAKAAGMIEDLPAAMAKRTSYSRTYEPNEANRSVYERGYRKYLALSEKLKEID